MYRENTTKFRNVEFDARSNYYYYTLIIIYATKEAAFVPYIPRSASQHTKLTKFTIYSFGTLYIHL